MHATPAATTDSALTILRPHVADWKKIVTKYQRPSVGHATWQLINTVVPYLGCWVGMWFAASYSFWLVVPLAILAGALMVRMFIIFHDCTHGSFLKSSTANNIIGFISGILTFTPYYHWRWEHSLHHASSGNLDKRGIGDIWTLTVQEYLESSFKRKLAYRLARNPLILFIIGPLFLFLIWNRWPNAAAPKRERQSVVITNLCVGLMVVGLIWAFGVQQYLIIQLMVSTVATSVGVWMFYMQHQFEGVYWERQDEWDYTAAALEGSSFYKLPRVLQWFSGNIGFHHIHHLSPRIPNYHLERCHKSEPLFQAVKPITLLSSLKCFRYRLWDEESRELVTYRRMRQIRKQRLMLADSQRQTAA